MNPDEARYFATQYQALRDGMGVVDLAGWSSVALTGADRETFLHNFCTNDVKRLSPGDGCEAFFCNVKGKIIGHGLVTCRDSELVVIGPPGQGELLAAHLDRYVIREDVMVRDTTAARAYLLGAGRIAREARSATASFGWPLLDTENVTLLEVPSAELSNAMQRLVAREQVRCNWDAFDALRIEAGTPLFGIDFDGQNFPQEVGRNAQAISFTKGCYLGQETVARIDALGHVNQQIVGVAFTADVVPPVGTELTRGDTNVGRVTSATFSPVLQRPLTLAMVRREHNAVGTQLESRAGPGEVVALPVTARPAVS